MDILPQKGGLHRAYVHIGVSLSTLKGKQSAVKKRIKICIFNLIFLQDIEHREEGGTPAIVEAIRGGMVMQLKQNITPELIKKRNCELNRYTIVFILLLSYIKLLC